MVGCEAAIWEEGRLTGAATLKGLILKRVSHESERERNTSPHPGGNAKMREELESVENRIRKKKLILFLLIPFLPSK